MIIRNITRRDIKSTLDIYNSYIESSVATFEEETIDAAELEQRIDEVLTKGGNWLVADDNGIIMGYAYSSDWHKRSAFRFSTEVSAYLSNAYLSQGVGTALYSALFKKIEENKKHSIIASITLPNPSSVSLHEKFGMQKVAHLNEVGFKFGQWLDVGYWQLVLNS